MRQTKGVVVKIVEDEVVKEAKKKSEEINKALNSPPIIVEDVTETDEPTLEIHLIGKDLMKIALKEVKDSLLLGSPIIMQIEDSPKVVVVSPTLAS